MLFALTKSFQFINHTFTDITFLWINLEFHLLCFFFCESKMYHKIEEHKSKRTSNTFRKTHFLRVFSFSKKKSEEKNIENEKFVQKFTRK